jgi:hypothetical protein
LSFLVSKVKVIAFVCTSYILRHGADKVDPEADISGSDPDNMPGYFFKDLSGRMNII